MNGTKVKCGQHRGMASGQPYPHYGIYKKNSRSAAEYMELIREVAAGLDIT